MSASENGTFRRLADIVRSNPLTVVSGILAALSFVLVPPSSECLDYIDLRTLCILFCFMAAVAGMRRCNLFGMVAGRLLAGKRSMRRLCIIMVALPFFTSMLMTNDVALLTFVPFTIFVLDMVGRKDAILPVVILQTLAANLGSMLLPFGNPQNLYIHSRYTLDTMDVVVTLGPLVIVSAVLLFAMCLLIDRESVTVEMSRDREVRDRGFLWISVALFTIGILTVVRIVPYGVATIVTAVVMLLTRRDVLKNVDYGLLLTFVFLFLFTGNLSHIDSVSSALSGLMTDDPMLTSLCVSQVFSNVPAATLLSGFTEDWSGLISGVDIGGFGTPIASMASMISLGFYVRTEGSDLKRYLLVFTVANVAMLLALTSVYYIL